MAGPDERSILFLLREDLLSLGCCLEARIALLCCQVQGRFDRLEWIASRLSGRFLVIESCEDFFLE